MNAAKLDSVEIYFFLPCQSYGKDKILHAAIGA